MLYLDPVMQCIKFVKNRMQENRGVACQGMWIHLDQCKCASSEKLLER